MIGGIPREMSIFSAERKETSQFRETIKETKPSALLFGAPPAEIGLSKVLEMQVGEQHLGTLVFSVEQKGMFLFRWTISTRGS